MFYREQIFFSKKYWTETQREKNFHSHHLNLLTRAVSKIELSVFRHQFNAVCHLHYHINNTGFTSLSRGHCRIQPMLMVLLTSLPVRSVEVVHVALISVGLGC